MNISLKKSAIAAALITVLSSAFFVQAHEDKNDGQMAEDKSGMPMMMKDMKGMMSMMKSMSGNMEEMMAACRK